MRPGTPYSQIFGSGVASDSHLTLMQALWLNGTSGGNSVLAQSVAAVLNAYRFGSDSFGYSPDQVVQMVRDGVYGGQVTNLLQDLTTMNERS